MKFPTLLLTTALAVLASACAGPQLTPPKPLPAAPVAWSANADATSDAAKLDWWTDLHDAELDRLVATALANNADLRVATHNWQATATVVREAQAAKLPIGNVEGSLTRTKTAGAPLQLDTFGGPKELPAQTLANVGVGFGWEIDLFGRIAGENAAARADSAKALWQRRGVEASIAAAVVRAWFDLAAADRQIAIAHDRAALLADVAERLGQAGAVGGVRRDVVEDARLSLAQVRQQMPLIEAARRNALRRIATLTGRPAPEGVSGMVRTAPAALPIPAYVRAGRPEDILRLRPDVAAAEQDLLKATARIKVARADLYPRLSLFGTAGLTAPPGDLLSAGAPGFSIGPSISWGLFDMDRIRARISGAGAQAQAAGAAWESAFLKALEDSDAALDSFAAARRSVAIADTALANARASAALANARFTAGQDNLLTNAVARDRVLQAVQAREQAETDLRAAWIAAQVALGAGWRDVALSQ